MSGVAGAALAGLSAGLRAPLWLRGRRWTELLRPPASSRPGAAPARGSVRASRAAIRWLARLPGDTWRNTCLYRSVAECLVLRHYGVPAVVRIGVRPDDEPGAGILAHAWVVADPAAEPEPPDAMHPFPVGP